MSDTVQEMVKAILQAQIVQALSSSDAIEKLVTAALSKPVDNKGNPDGYSGDKKPYLDYITGEVIRTAAYQAMQEAIKEHKPKIQEIMSEHLKTKDVVASFVQSLIGLVDQEWRMNVTFKGEEKSRY